MKVSTHNTPTLGISIIFIIFSWLFVENLELRELHALCTNEQWTGG